MNAFRYNQTRIASPLTDDQIRSLAPSVFAEDKHEATSTRYQFISTAQVVTALRNEGFQPMRASQSRARLADRRDFTRHMITFRMPEASGLVKVDDTAPEVVLLNSHDGTSSYQLHAGLFRLVCSNGLIVSDGMLAAIRVKHFGKNVIDGVVDGMFSIIHELPDVLNNVEAWRETRITNEVQTAYATAALDLRYDADEHRPVQPAALLTTRRREDQGDDLWTTFNRVQENVVRGGLRGRLASGKQAKTREVKGVSENVRLNKALWTLTQSLADILGTATTAPTVIDM